MSRVRLRFEVPYLTVWGQKVVLRIKPTKQEPLEDIEMRCHWKGQPLEGHLVWETDWNPSLLQDIEYKYVVVDEEGNVVKSESRIRQLALEKQRNRESRVIVHDTWQDASCPYNIVARTAFRRAIGFPELTTKIGCVPRVDMEEDEVIVRFVIRDGMRLDLEKQKLYITGGAPGLGNWLQEKVFALTCVGEPIWEGELSVPRNCFPFTYKYAICNERGLILETGESRLAMLYAEEDSEESPDMVVYEDGHFRHEKLWKGAGIAVPVFSLRSRQSLGVGEFLDLKLLIDLCSKIGFDVVQILPVNDTRVHGTWWDSYPYSSLSVFALHPIYLRIEDLMLNLPKEIQDQIEDERSHLEGPVVDYEAALETKLRLAHSIYRLDGTKTLKSTTFAEFFESNADWLKPYAAFLFLQELFETAEHWKWGNLSKPTQADISRIVSPDTPQYFGSIAFSYWLQFHLHRQLTAVKHYAEEKGVALKGDLPIGVDKCSVDTWMYPSLFRMNKSTGAPPDAFDMNGQNWGFPTYNWEEMEKDDFTWWRKRLHHMEELIFVLCKIDHILGFFRIWEIPDTSVTATLGRFRPSYPIHRHELEANGIWDIERLCYPYITETFLDDVFGDLKAEAVARYFVLDDWKRYRLNGAFNTEKKISQLKSRHSIQVLEKETNQIKRGLFKCIQNVVLIRDEDNPDAFYPRFDLMETASYQNLETWQRDVLRRLHDDYFFHRQNELWRSHALKTLPALIRASDMLVCGEDLGMIPDCVHPVMNELGLIGLRIQRMPSEGEFGDPRDYPYLTVCSAACHDVSTLRAWWEKDPNRSQRFYDQFVVYGEGKAPSECTPEIAKKILQLHFQSPSVLAIFQIQDLFAMSEKYNDRPPEEESINDPTNPRHYWRYRMHVNLETLLEDEELANEIDTLLKSGSRGKSYWMGKRCWLSTNGSKNL